ncbi:MAG: hypothetical protein MnENMB40S_25040 [Rhizobiaceae bacterium MnEN-MB40S]|nr:MAG: hypothetical protein MnENMB40S_25040 [Rhizobiaceae bacterium MnEN-MB40S]
MTLEERILGKTFAGITCSKHAASISFSDESGFGVFTRIRCDIVKQENCTVTECVFNDEKAWMKIGWGSTVEISMDANDLVGPEFYAFCDVDATWVVAN